MKKFQKILSTTLLFAFSITPFLGGQAYAANATNAAKCALQGNKVAVKTEYAKIPFKCTTANCQVNSCKIAGKYYVVKDGKLCLADTKKSCETTANKDSNCKEESQKSKPAEKSENKETKKNDCQKPSQPSKPVEKPDAGNKPDTNSPVNPTPTPDSSKPTEEEQKPSENTANASAFEQQVLDLVNQERAKAGLKPLKMNSTLVTTARVKSQDMADNNYFAHDSKTLGSPFDLMKKYNVSYKTAGENIAAGQTTPEAVMKAWMNSAGHKANILSADYTEMGVGFVKGGSYGYYWTQHFIGK